MGSAASRASGAVRNAGMNCRLHCEHQMHWGVGRLGVIGCIASIGTAKHVLRHASYPSYTHCYLPIQTCDHVQRAVLWLEHCNPGSYAFQDTFGSRGAGLLWQEGAFLAKGV